ncbi:hypothetical protein JD844_023028 [Phrynosoma platyrhinos]|uniref:Myb/SANT-like DNA-binding domain-containing protein n=1 Tax=Phrynosoma platyrhinos TaxID=52577 RepID=A0ABQ7SWF0_PHRPL|nr:hypothetical protein JD844_023028 [Phrynosoma platyrhinos]
MLPIYAEISGKLMEKGIHRSVQEIRNKCKTLKSEYNKVNNHNKISGNAPATCPFFAEMDRFLHMEDNKEPPYCEKTHWGPEPRNHLTATPSIAASGCINDRRRHFPPAISEEGNVILHLVPVEQPLALDPHPTEDMEPQDLPSSHAASDETMISGEGPQEEATQSPGGETQATGPKVGSDSPQEAAVRRVPVCTVVRRVRADEDIPDRRARRGEFIARTIIEDCRREGRLNRVLARRQHKSLLWTIRREAASLESLARSYCKDLAVTAQHRQRMFRYMEELINICRESMQEQRNRTALKERELARKHLDPIIPTHWHPNPVWGLGG